MTIPYSSSNQTNNRKQGWPAWVILGIVTLLSVSSYLLVSAIKYRTGFPLDDAWIHQTYARNLALHGEWAFNPGKPSGGSTAPLWSALLAIGFLLKLSPYAWTFLLGALALWGISLLGENTVRGLVPAYRPRFPWVGAALALEWHLVWAAVSGMETLLYALLATAALVYVISGFAELFQPGFADWPLSLGKAGWNYPARTSASGHPVIPALLAEALAGVGKYWAGFWKLPLRFTCLFNLIVSGHPWPNTFYAKQAEYAVYLKMPFLERLGSEALQPLIGAGVILLPGMILAILSAVRRRSWGLLAAAAWLAGFLILYAWLLPVTYQHGRYVIPAMPIFFLLGLTGLVEFALKTGSRHSWVLPTFWRLAMGLTLLVFWVRGSFAYAQDVAVIESEMVATAKWVSQNVPTDTLVAAHDIGALGYYGKHEVVDLAGLISPEVIPFLRDEKRIAAYLSLRGVGCLVTFPDWYPSLTANLTPIFTTGAPFAPALGEVNMAVYRWPGP